MESQFDDELLQLKNALRQETFRFILVGHNRFSIYQDISSWLRTTLPERHFLELRLANKDYRQINDELVAFNKGIVLIPDFGWLFRKGNESACVAFNQRRDAFARLDIALVCFIEPSEFIEVPKKVPDWWSLRSLELDFHRETTETSSEFLSTESEASSSLGGQTKGEKEAEIQRLGRQIEATESTNKGLLSILYFQIGTLTHDLSQFKEALNYLEQSLLLYRQIDDQKDESAILNNIGQIYQAWGDYNKALEYFENSLQSVRQVGNKEREAPMLNNIGLNYRLQGDYTKALEYYEQSLILSRQIGDKVREGTTLNNIGLNYRLQGDYDKAIEYYKQSLAIRQQIGDQAGVSTTLNNIGGIYRIRGEYSKVLEYLNQSLAINRQVGNKAAEGTILNNIGQIYEEQGDYNKSLEYLNQSLAINRQVSNNRGIAITLSNLGILYFSKIRDIEKAIHVLLEARSIFQQIGSPDVRVPEGYLNSIHKEIGEGQFNQIVQANQNDPQF